MGMKVARGLYSLWIAVLVVSLNNAHATNQHMICKTVETVFTNEVVGPNFSRPKAFQGPVGNRGQSGVKGEPGLPGSKGERGIPSTFNPADVENMMEMKISAATKELRDKIEILENKVTELNSTSASGHQSAGDPEAIECEDGIIYRQKCYFAPFVHPTYDVPSTYAQDICEGNRGRLADILDREHQRLITNYLRPKIPSSQSYVQMWLGMLYQISTKTLHWSDGTIVDASLNWYSSFPHYDYTRTNVAIVVKKVTTANSNGLINVPPTYTTNGALCEK